MGTQSDGAPKKLGSLAQAARGKHLNQIRGILFAIGILTIIVNAALWAMLRDQVRQELNKAGINNPVQRQQIEEKAVQFGTLVYAVTIGVGALYIVFGLIVERYPVPVTVTALVIYVTAMIIFAILNAENAEQQLLAGLPIKILIIVAMIGAIKTAITYERERKAASEELAYDYE